MQTPTSSASDCLTTSWVKVPKELLEEIVGQGSYPSQSAAGIEDEGFGKVIGWGLKSLTVMPNLDMSAFIIEGVTQKTYTHFEYL